MLKRPNLNARRLTLVAVALLALAAGIASACGPYFRESLLRQDEARLFRAPVGYFASELERIDRGVPAKFKAILPDDDHDAYTQTVDADVAELTAALKRTKKPEPERAALVATYRQAREALTAHQQALAAHRRHGEREDPPRLDERAIASLDFAALPHEFALYMRGAVAHAKGDHASARKHWRQLLELPAADRHYRSTWAAYMIGRTCVDDDPAQAAVWFDTTRILAKKGFADALGLAAASLGWQARAALECNEFDQAVQLYMTQLATGDESAVASLQICVRMIFASDRAVQLHAARDQTTQRIVTAYLISDARRREDREQHRADAWLAVVREAQVDRVAAAERLAWLAYDAGQFDLAAQWIELADEREPMTLWIASRLALRKGEIERGMQLLAAASNAFAPAVSGEHPAAVPSSTHAELGVLHLARGQYVDSLHQLLRAGYWEEAAYVAERVLTVDELRTYVDAHWPPRDEAMDEEPAQWLTQRIRHLLARRLTRIGRWRDARAYFPSTLQMKLDDYIAAIRRGHDRSLDARQRAEAFWSAALAARRHGMELLGTELGPDWALYDGSFDLGSGDAESKGRPSAGVIAAGADELQRVNASLAEIPVDKRFHYRYTAADHAWSAVSLMPDNDNLTAERLLIAGRWLANRDPQAADRFYKALVRRCGRTTLGREADRLRWFPPLPKHDADD